MLGGTAAVASANGRATRSPSNRWGVILSGSIIVLAALAAYHNSFTVPFLFDDVRWITENPTIRHLWPIWDVLLPSRSLVNGRPVVNFSLAVNYALGGFDVWGYHALNLAVHILAGLTLLGVVRRTLLQPALRERFGAAANKLALAVAIIWTVHPLQTESVTYVIQRAESIMGLFYLLTLYCFIRGATSPKPRPWYGLCIGACTLGMASKEVMASAPLLVLLYDRAFVSGSFREALRRRWQLYLGLSATWILLGFLIISAGTFAATSVMGQQAGVVTRWVYLLTEPGAILHYLRLAVWPYPLCFDYYGWPVACAGWSILPTTLVVAVLLGATTWACKTNSAWGVLGAWFFLILAPSSSIIPLDSPVYEHRMYLSLAAVIVIEVMAIHALIGRRAVAMAMVLAVALGVITWRRNQDYRSDIAIWQDAALKCPNNSRAHNNLGAALVQANRLTEGLAHLEQALSITPGYAAAHSNLGVALTRVGKVPEAIGQYEEALKLKPDYPKVQNNLAWLLTTRVPAEAKDPVRAVTLAEQACKLTDNQVASYLDTLAAAYAAAGRFDDAIATAQKAIQLADSTAQTQLVSKVEMRLELYRANHAYYEPENATGSRNP
jgi:protein O-mannosyl-transferase